MVLICFNLRLIPILSKFFIFILLICGALKHSCKTTPMTRLYVKNLPQHATEQQIRNHFKESGTITDVQLIQAEDGHFKRIAFIGFHNGDYKEIKKRYDGTYIGSSKISIYEALSHEAAINTNRKRNQEFKPKEREGAQAMVKEILNKGGKELEDYVNFTKQKSWQNELLNDAPKQQNASAEQQNTQKQEQKQEKEFDEVKLKLVNLPKTTQEQDLLKTFEQFGPIQEAVISVNPLTKEPNGTGYVTFQTPYGLSKALKHKEILIQGKFVQLKQSQVAEVSQRVKVFEYFKKAFDKTNSQAWNQYTQNQENVAQQLSSRLGVSETQLNQNAVAMAVGEAVINEELKEKMQEIGLGSEGVRSKTAILVKNLSSDVTVDTIKQMYGQFGVMIVCDLFYQGFCLVQYAQPSDARRAFNRMAFRKVGKTFTPMMLEWAILADKTADAKKDEQNEGKEEEAKQKERNIHIKSVSFSTTTDKYEQVLKQALGEDFISCKLVSGATTHRGYGFCEVREESFEKCIGKINQIIQDGFKWEASAALQKKQNDQTEELDTSKLIIKNLAFQANQQELQTLLKQFGRVVSFRAPKKLDNTLRGFAFVEYATPREAAQALAAVGSTHFYGRHLVAEPSYEKEMGQEAQEDLK